MKWKILLLVAYILLMVITVCKVSDMVCQLGKKMPDTLENVAR
jgi:hypothetical protein